MTIIEYAKLPAKEKEALLFSSGQLIDSWNEGNEETFLYTLDGFFVERIQKQGLQAEIMPYRRGFSAKGLKPKAGYTNALTPQKIDLDFSILIKRAS